MTYKLLFDETGVTSVGVIRDRATAAEVKRRHDFLQRIAVAIEWFSHEVQRIEQEYRRHDPRYGAEQRAREDEIDFYWLDFFRAHDDLKLMANRDILQAALDREDLPVTPENLELVSRIEEARQTLAKKRSGEMPAI